jgi:hypothetical protein
VRAHQVLEGDLVDADRRGKHAGADVGHVEQLEQALHRAVLAERAVQHGPDDVAAQQATARLERDRPALVRPAAVAGETQVDHLVARLGQAGAHRGRRVQRHVVLARAAAGQDRDPHQGVGVVGVGAGVVVVGVGVVVGGGAV